jgi:hypothetical protein
MAYVRPGDPNSELINPRWTSRHAYILNAINRSERLKQHWTKVDFRPALMLSSCFYDPCLAGLVTQPRQRDLHRRDFPPSWG